MAPDNGGTTPSAVSTGPHLRGSAKGPQGPPGMAPDNGGTTPSAVSTGPHLRGSAKGAQGPPGMAPDNGGTTPSAVSTGPHLRGSAKGAQGPGMAPDSGGTTPSAVSTGPHLRGSAINQACLTTTRLMSSISCCPPRYSFRLLRTALRIPSANCLWLFITASQSRSIPYATPAPFTASVMPSV